MPPNFINSLGQKSPDFCAIWAMSVLVAALRNIHDVQVASGTDMLARLVRRDNLAKEFPVAKQLPAFACEPRFSAQGGNPNQYCDPPPRQLNIQLEAYSPVIETKSRLLFVTPDID